MKKVLVIIALIVISIMYVPAFAQDEYVDLGLSSGTKWSNTNEYDLYTYDEAVSKFGSKLPTKRQWEELRDECEWKRIAGSYSYKVTGPNGNSITLPGAGMRTCRGKMVDKKLNPGGYYWSSTPKGTDHAWGSYFFAGGVGFDGARRCLGHSVRLVQD